MKRIVAALFLGSLTALAAPSGGAVPRSPTANAIEKRLRTSRPTLARCYNARLKERPDLAGVISIQFTIEKTGKIEAAAMVKSTVGDEGLETCVLDAVRRLRFERLPIEGVIEVTYPFKFSPKQITTP